MPDDDDHVQPEHVEPRPAHVNRHSEQPTHEEHGTDLKLKQNPV